MTHERALSPADLFGGKAPVGALYLAFWSEFAIAYAAQVYSLCASVTAVYLSFFVFGTWGKPNVHFNGHQRFSPVAYRSYATLPIQWPCMKSFASAWDFGLNSFEPSEASACLGVGPFDEVSREVGAAFCRRLSAGDP